MTASKASPGSNDQTGAATGSERNIANIIYILYLVSPIFWVTGLIGVIMAYVNRGDAPGWLWTHYDFQIRTFWIGLLYLAISAATSLIVIGYGLLLLYLIWLVVRCAKGMKHLARAEPHPDPRTWMLG